MVRLQTRTLGNLENASVAGRHEMALKAIRETQQSVELIAELERLRKESRGTMDLRHLRPVHIALYRDMNVTKRYAHPKEQTILLRWIGRKWQPSGHTSRHTVENTNLESRPVLALTV